MISLHNELVFSFLHCNDVARRTVLTVITISTWLFTAHKIVNIYVNILGYKTETLITLKNAEDVYDFEHYMYVGRLNITRMSFSSDFRRICRILFNIFQSVEQKPSEILQGSSGTRKYSSGARIGRKPQD
jgi:hypothetical protein